MLDPLFESLAAVPFRFRLVESEQDGDEPLVAQAGRLGVETRLVGERDHAFKDGRAGKIKHSHQVYATRSETVFVIVQNFFNVVGRIETNVHVDQRTALSSKHPVDDGVKHFDRSVAAEKL